MTKSSHSGETKKVYTRLSEIPLDMATPFEWRKRGYAVKGKSEPVAWAFLSIAGETKKLPLYDLGQCRWLRGKKAEVRRALYVVKLYKEDEPL